jgi:hypothetical protein
MNALTSLWKKHPHWLLVVALALLLLLSAFALPMTPHIVDKVDQLAQHPTKKFPQRSLDKIQRIAVHNSGKENQTAEIYASYHVNTNNWPGIGYHFVIEDDSDGTIIQTNYLTTISYGVDGGNTPTINICLSGNFSEREPSKAQLKSLGKLIRHLRRTLKRNIPVYGHGTLQPHKPTSCPGNYLKVHLDQYNQGSIA